MGRLMIMAVLVALMLCNLSTAIMAVQVPLLNDNFESYDIGHAFINHNKNTVYTDAIIHTNWYSVSGALTSGFTHTMIDSGDPTAGKVVDLCEETATTGYGFFYHCFKKTYDFTVHAQCDVMLPQNTAGFRIALNQIIGKYPASGAQANNGNSWAAAICFEGNVPLAGTVSAPGRISYQTNAFTQVWADSGFTYTPNQWYTVRIEAYNVGSSNPYTYKVFFGPRGGTLTEITPAGGVPWIIRRGSATDHVGMINGISFGTSEKASPETGGHMYIDRVYVDGNQEVNLNPDPNVPEHTPLSPTNLTELKRMKSGLPGGGIAGGINDPPEPGDYVETFALGGTNDNAYRVASMGTDQLGQFFYLVTGDRAAGKMNPEGIRVRMNPSIISSVDGTVRVGDRIDLDGYIQKADDSGMMTRYTGEREIYAIQLAAYRQPPEMVKLPAPIAITNKNIGGGNFTFEGYQDRLTADAFLMGVFSGVNPAGGYFRQAGLNNVGTFGKFCGKVTYVATDPTQKSYPYFYIDDGSGVNDGSHPDGTNSKVGVRVLMNKNRFLDGGAYFAEALASLQGKYVIVTGIVGAVSSNDLGETSTNYNIRVIRAYEEPFFEQTGNYLYDPEEMFYTDLNQNSKYDGIFVVNP